MHKRYLFDTQVLVWLEHFPARIGKNLIHLIERREIYFSSISVAELSFMRSLGKYLFNPDLPSVWNEAGIMALNFDTGASFACPSFSSSQVPDPMYRQIMATAAANNLILVNSDRKILAQNFDWILDATT
jgi:PIN domain nuclease of toxin-antitoxin system